MREDERRWGVARILALAFAMAATLLAAPCSARSPRPSPDIPLDPRFEVTLQRTACFGTCPVYSVRINSRGQVTWNGEQYVAATGVRTKRIPRSAVQRLQRIVTWSGFMDLPPTHGRVGTDLPSQTVVVTMNGRTHAVTNYYPRGASPAAFTGVAEAIDEEAGTAAWVGPRPQSR